MSGTESSFFFLAQFSDAFKHTSVILPHLIDETQSEFI